MRCPLYLLYWADLRLRITRSKTFLLLDHSELCNKNNTIGYHRTVQLVITACLHVILKKIKDQGLYLMF